MLPFVLAALPNGVADAAVLQAFESGPPSESSDGKEQAAVPPADAFTIDVPFVLNGRYVGDLTIAVSPDGAAYARPPDVTALLEGRADDAVIEATLEAGSDPTSLDVLSAGPLRLTFDPAELAVDARLNVDGGALTRLSLSGQRVYDPAQFDEPAPTAALLTVRAAQAYAWNDGQGAEELLDPVAAVEGLVGIGGFGGLTLSGGADARGSDVRVRDVAVTKDLFDRAVRIQVGEVLPDIRAFQATGDLLGLSVARRYQEIRPFQNVRPAGRRAFTLEAASVVEAYVGGQLVATERLEAGRYQLDDLPLRIGANDIEIVVLSDTGQRSVISYAAAFRPLLLARGVTDFAFAAGYATSEAFEAEGAPRATGHVARGLGGGVTVGLMAQASEDAYQVGGLVSGAGGWGFLSGQVGLSGASEGGEGLAASVDYRQEFDLGSPDALVIAATVEGRTARFTDYRTPEPANTQALRGALNANYRFSGSTTASLSAFGTIGRTVSRGERDVAAPDTARINATITHRFGDWVVSAVGSQGFGGRDDAARLSFRLSRRLGNQLSTAVRYEPTSDDVELELARFGARRLGSLDGSLRLGREDDDDFVRLRSNYIANRAEVGLRHDRLGRADAIQQRTTLNVGTSIGFADGKVGIGRPATAGFAVVSRHPSLKGSDVMLTEGSRPVGRVGGPVPLLVPLLRSYVPRVLQVGADPLPIGYDIGSGELDVLPGFFDGYAAEVGSDASRTVLGVLTDAGGQPVALAVGALRPEGGDAEDDIAFFTNRGGRFVAERVSAGTYEVRLSDRVIGRLTIQKSQEGLVDVGTISVAP